MIRLNDLLPVSQHEEYWTISGSNHDGLPDDAKYVIIEYYCSNPACKCKSLVADILGVDANGVAIDKSLSIIDYDWSTKKLACQPQLNSESPKTELAHDLFEAYKTFIHMDEYMVRIKNQYSHVKILTMNKNIGMSRNAPCHCGSGKKYKRCCLGKS